MDTNEIIKSQIASLPNEISSFIKKNEWFETVKNISSTRNLSFEQITSLTNEVLFVLIGWELKDDFSKNIKTALNVNDQVAQEVTIIVSEKIFKSIENFLPKEKEGGEAQNLNPQNQIFTPPKIELKVSPTTASAPKNEARETLQSIANKEFGPSGTVPAQNLPGAKSEPKWWEVEAANDKKFNKTPSTSTTPIATSPTSSTPSNKPQQPQANVVSYMKELPGKTPPIQNSSPVQTSLDKKISDSLQKGVDKIVKTSYPGGIDPYREPIQ